MANIVSK